MEKQYKDSRPTIPAEVRRTIEVEAGHKCSIKECGEHTYLEIHHINFNREDNSIENLILLCDKHHKMAYKKVIDRKALAEHKKRLAETSELTKKVANLGKLLSGTDYLDKVDNNDESVLTISSTTRHEVFYQTLSSLSISKLEREEGKTYRRNVEVRISNLTLHLDAVCDFTQSAPHVLLEVVWLRKMYLDAPIYVKQFEQKLSLYETLTNSTAKGTLIFIVPKDSMKNLDSLPYSSKAVEESTRKIKVVIYTYHDLGFKPGAISAEIIEKYRSKE